MTRQIFALRRRLLPVAAVLLLSAALPVHAQTQPQTQTAPAAPSTACSPTVSAALSTWDAGMAAASRFGDKAVALAREKGREYLLPLLGIYPQTAPPEAGADSTTTRDLGRAVEDSRDDPERRAELCAAITRAADTARDKADAGWEALKRALDDWRLTPPDAAPSAPAVPSPAKPDGSVKI